MVPVHAVLVASVALAATLAGCSSGGGDGAHEGGVFHVTIQGYAFSPTSLPVRQGDTVVFENEDGVAHTATLDSGERDTGSIAAGGQGQFALPTPGSQRYHCKVHPSMTGTIIVAAD